VEETLVQQPWLIVALGVIALFLAIKVFKFAVRSVMTVLVVALVVGGAAYYLYSTGAIT
jgi:type IV secretory pathway TrbL component